MIYEIIELEQSNLFIAIQTICQYVAMLKSTTIHRLIGIIRYVALIDIFLLVNNMQRIRNQRVQNNNFF